MDEFITKDKVRDIDVIRFAFREINLEQYEELKKKLKELVHNGDTKFIIDLTEVGFLSSLVIAAIVFFAKEVRKKNGTLKISGLSVEAFNIFQLTQLDKDFELFESEKAAIASFSGSL